MKITVISFDFWSYDAPIVEELRRLGIHAQHINFGALKHKNWAARAKNAFSKLFLGKNLKKLHRQEFILEHLKKNGGQDQVLVINPELIDRTYHEKIKPYTKRYIAYLYDSLARCPAEHLLDLFDEVYSFDKSDCERHGFKLITNYIYLPESQISPEPKFDLVYLASYDGRLKFAERIAARLDYLGTGYHFEIIGKKAWKKFPTLPNHKITYSAQRVPHSEIPKIYSQGRAILDLVREDQDGLSFRIFEAMALKKKIVTDNQTISTYDFYNPNNILILRKDLHNLEKSFFETEYQDLNPETYYKYTLENWVKTVFNL